LGDAGAEDKAHGFIFGRRKFSSIQESDQKALVRGDKPDVGLVKMKVKSLDGAGKKQGGADLGQTKIRQLGENAIGETSKFCEFAGVVAVVS